MKESTTKILSFYKFFAIKNLEDKKKKLYDFCEPHNIKGLIIMAKEGVNGTISGSEEALLAFEKTAFEILDTDAPQFKTSFSHKSPFRRFKVKVREEIVTLNGEHKVPEGKANHLSPEDWQNAIEKEDVILLDARNDYEMKVGKFKNTICPDIQQFQDFPKYLKENPLPKDKKILIYCTGGIRCEKAILEMNKQDYKNVFQLDGGILKYLEKFPNEQFEGECFVFDHRVAVDQNLQTSKNYYLCVHCGDPSDNKIKCLQCPEEEFVCLSCLEKQTSNKTCSKNCRHHFELGHKTTRPHKDSQRRRSH